jgi:hypothetical protein
MPTNAHAKFKFKKLFRSMFMMPFVGYEQGKWESSYDDSVVSSTTYDDVIGVRYGFFAGIKFKKYFYVAGTMDWGNSSWKYNKADDFYYDDDFINSSASRSSIGAAFGVRLTKRSIFWLGYDFKNDLELSENHDPELPAPKYSGSGIKFGYTTATKKTLFSIFYHIDSYDELVYEGENEEEPVALPRRYGRFDIGEFKHSSFIISVSFFWGRFKGK